MEQKNETEEWRKSTRANNEGKEGERVIVETKQKIKMIEEAAQE